MKNPGKKDRKPQSQPTPQTPAVVIVPMKPRRNAMLILAAVFALWMAFLLVLYFKTVRH